MTGRTPRVSVVVSTRHRGGRIAEPARSILASAQSEFAVCLVDGSPVLGVLQRPR